MYSPFEPNDYVTYKFDCYRKRCRNEEETARRFQRAREETGDALSDALAGRPATGGALARSSESSHETSGALALHSLNLSAEEMHRRRVKESAARGVQRAVDIEKDTLLVQHKTRQQEGTDTRSKISGLLDRMRSRASATETDGNASNNNNSSSGSSSSDAMRAPEGAPPTDTAAMAPPPPPHGGPASPTAPSAPLAFKRSGLAAGGYVLDTASPRTQLKAAKPPLRGKPSSTLLVRFNVTPSPLTVVRTRHGTSAATSELEAALAPLVETVRQFCGRFGVVRSVRVNFLSAAELEAKVASFVGTDQERDACVEKERLRVFVRLNTVAEAFKVADAIVAAVPPPDAPLPSRDVASWSAVFFPSSAYDEGHLTPVGGEGFCQ